MPARTYYLRQPPTPRNAVSFGGVIKAMIMIAALIGAGWLLVQYTVQTRLAQAIQDKAQSRLGPTGLQIEIGDAKLIPNQGLKLADVSISLPDSPSQQTSPGSPKTNLKIYDMFVHTAIGITDLAAGDVVPDAIEIQRAKLTVVRSQDGSWDFQPAVEAILNLPRPANAPDITPVLLRDSEIQLVDLSNNRPPIVLSGINFTVAPVWFENRKLIQVQGNFQSRAISNIDFGLFVDQSNQTWNAKLTANQAALAHNLSNALPPQFATQLAGLKTLSGILNFTATAQGNNQLDSIPKFRLDGNLADVSLDDPKLPVAIKRFSTDFVIANEGFSVRNAIGVMDDNARFNFDFVQNGLFERKNFHCRGNVNNFLLNNRQRIVQWMPRHVTKFCDDFSPSGTSNISFDLQHDGKRLTKKINSTLTDMSFSFIKMPYRVNHCTGTVDLVDTHCDFNIRSKINNQDASLDGFVDNIGTGAGPTYHCNLKVPGRVPFDDKLLTALDAQPKLSAIIREFNPTGTVSGKGTITRRISRGPVDKKFDIRVAGCSVRHNHFPYPIYNVDGRVLVDNETYNFQNLTGNNSSGSVRCGGVWNSVNGLNVRFNCQSVPMDDQLRMALKPEIQEIWNGFRPRGTIDNLTVDMTCPIGQRAPDVAIEAVMHEENYDAKANYVSIYPTWFPYQINQLTGTVSVGDGKIKLTNMNGRHHKTTLACQGRGHYSNQTWSVQLQDLLATSLRVDEDLLFAVPATVKTPLAQLRFQGLANVNGQITLAGSKGSNQFSNNSLPTGTAQQVTNAASNTSMAWDVAINMSQVDMLVGLPLKNVFGGVRLKGIFDGENIDCDGELDLDSMTVYENQVTHITGPFKIDNERVSAGAYIDRFSADRGNLTPLAASSNAGASRSISGLLHKGIVRLDAAMNSSAPYDFQLQATVADGCLSTACKEIAPELTNVDGHSFAAIRLHGDGSGTHSYRGDGNIQLRDAKIYQLPVFISLLKILNVRQLTRTAFDSGNIDFKVLGDRIIFDRMEFNGDAISLIGNGEMNLDWDIDLNFYSVMGRNRMNIPLISELYRSGSKRTLAIKVGGKLDSPRTHRRVLPELNSNLKQLFQGSEANTRFATTPRPSTGGVPAANVGDNFFREATNTPFRYSNRLRR